MIPISDNNPRRRVPVVTLLIILVNVLVWLYEVSLPAPALNQFFASLALIPLRITNAPNAGAIFTLFSSMFMHAGWLHIIGNMLYLWIFGDNVEDRLGRGLFLLFYLAGGVLAALAQVAFAPGSQVPILGASGAIAAVLGAYLVLFPHQRVRNLVIIFFFHPDGRIASDCSVGAMVYPPDIKRDNGNYHNGQRRYRLVRPYRRVCFWPTRWSARAAARPGKIVTLFYSPLITR